MLSLFRWLVFVVVAVAAVWFAVVNRESVLVTWSPFHAPSDIPVFALTLGAALAGFILGGLFVTLGRLFSLKPRRPARSLEPLEQETLEP